MKDKYYRDGFFLEANLGRKPSYAWRSIWNLKKLLKEGLIWRVGDGTNIRIWEDPWIPKPRAQDALSPVNVLTKDAKVNELMDVHTNWWNIPLVKEAFNEEKASMICNLGVNPQQGRDRLAWEHTKNEVYTVKSAYHLTMERFGIVKASCSMVHQKQELWKQIWGIKGSRVVKFFVWKACNVILSTRERLYWKKITSDPLCIMCGIEPETIGRILWNCPSAQDVWLECKGKFQKCHSGEVGFIDLLEKLLERLDVEEMQLMVIVARHIWLHRNNVIFWGEFLVPSALVWLAKEQVKAYNAIEKRIGQTTPRPRQQKD